MSALQHKVAYARARMVKQLVVTAVLGMIVSAASAAAGIVVFAVGVFVSYVGPVLLPSRQIKTIMERAAADRDLRLHHYQEQHRQWQARVTAHDQSERARQAAALLWHPVALRSGPSRVDVFGGTSDGWASLLATLGASLMPSGHEVMVLDFTEQYVAGNLAGLVATRRQPVTHIELPAEVERFNVLAGLEPDEVADMLAQAVHTTRQSDSPVDLRSLDADLLEGVATRLDGPATFRRLVAGLEVLRRTYDITAEGPLSVAEVTRLTSHVDTMGQSERVQHELQFLASTLNLLARDEPRTDPEAGADPDQPSGLWQADGLTIITTFHNQHRRKDFLDRVVFHRLLHDLRSHRPTHEDNVLVVAGADAIGLEGLESLARQCRRIGIRLVLMLERLRGDLREMLGSSDSAAVLMRLGNAQDAAAAAEFIGRGHKLVLSQITAQVGKTFTRGTSHTSGTTVGSSTTTGTSTSKGRSWSASGDSWLADTVGGSFSTTRSQSFTESRSQSWQDTVNLSEADARTDGTTHARVYEFAVEPTTIQSLPPTAFVLVETPSNGRRVVIGDCNPGITLLERVAAEPLPA
ncbi:hypothetical protein [Streptomyces sp. URMC 129]|uniref:hypothetical protein n=1 Tax=Streptomyces sp. URMC 129 TaxID=3423407 RepID=UPI003F1E064F